MMNRASCIVRRALCMAVVVGCGSAWAGTPASTYVPVEWIKASKTQWIYTNYRPTCTDKVEMKVKFSNVSDTQCLYCSRGKTTTEDTFTAFLVTDTKKIRFDRKGSTSESSSMTVGTKDNYVFVADGNSLTCTVNGVKAVDMASGTFAPGSVFSLFASHTQGDALSDTTASSSMGNWGSYTLYYFRVYDKDGKLVRQFLPARDDSVSSGTARYGLYETETQTFHPGLGSGSFTAGPKGDWRINPDTQKAEFRVNFASNDDSRGSVAAEVGGSAATSPLWCEAGASVRLTPTPASGYKFLRWTGDTDGVAVDAAGVATFFSAVARTLTAVFVPSSADPVDRSWSGSGDGKDWFDANNWQPVGVPAEGDFITIGTGKSIVLTNSTEELSSLSLASTLACSNWTTCIRAVDVKLLSGAVVKPICAFSNSDMSNRVWISATTLDIASGASINANGFGYKAKCGPGWDGVSASGCGGSHGGTGSDGKGKTYGSVTEPTDAGSGGYDVGSYIGQNGGGVVRIEATGAVVVDGTITATGTAGSYGQESGAGGAIHIACQTISGAGRIAADGGGNKTINNAALYVRAVGGGGRIAVAYDPDCQAEVSCDIAFSVRGGADQKTANQSQLNVFGQEGTLYFADDTLTKRPLIKLAGRVYYGPEVTHLSSLSYPGDFAPADTLLVFEDGGEIDIGGDLVLTGNIARLYGIVDKGHAPTIRIGGDLVLAGASLRVMDCRTMTVGGDVRFVDGPNGMNRAELYFRAAATNGTDGAYGGVIDVAGDWTMGNYSVYTPSCNGGCGSIVRTTAASLTLTTTAKINANGEGYDGNTGPGRSNGSQPGSTHAGKGAGNASATYGNKKCPVTPGSGSGHPSYSLLKGGGVVLFETRGRMTLNGSVTANGVNSPQGNYSGSSAGGSVWLLCGTKLEGTNAVITANAGDSTWTSSSNYKGGGGGYVSIWYQSLSDDVADWTVTARGGMLTREAARTSAWGEDGKTYWRQWHKGLTLFVR